MSIAVTPPVRTRRYPGGVPWCSAKERCRVKDGNSHAAWMARLRQRCLAASVAFWLENPDSSWLWRQKGTLKLVKASAASGWGFWRADYCGFRTPWRKRTRFFVSMPLLSSVSTLCKGCPSHQRLRGMCTSTESWTSVAQAYLAGVCKALAFAVLDQLATVSGDHNWWKGLRIGGAAKPGPREFVVPVSRSFVDLGDQDRIKPPARRRAMRSLALFAAWFCSVLPDFDLDQVVAAPLVLGPLLREFGLHLYRSGRPRYWFVDTTNALTEKFPWLRGKLRPCGELEPSRARPALPAAIYRSMVVCSLLWGWYSFAGCLVLGFRSIARISDV